MTDPAALKPDHARIERDFAALLAEGWPSPAAPRHPGGGLVQLLARHGWRMALQLVNSSVPETRAFWRVRLGLPAEERP